MGYLVSFDTISNNSRKVLNRPQLSKSYTYVGIN